MMKSQRIALLAIAALCSACQAPSRQDGNDLNTLLRHYDGPIIDMHAHAFSEETHEWFFGMEHPPTLRGETYQGIESAADQQHETLEQYRQHNVVKAMVSGGELWIEDAPDQILVGAGMEPIEALRRQHQAGRLDVIGELAPFYAGMRADDPAILEYFALAEELDVPVAFHILPGGPNGGLYLMPQLSQMRAANAHPLQLENALVRHPNVRVYVMHGGWPYVEDMKALMYAHPQVYVDVSVINWLLPEDELHHYLKALVDAGFGDRIMYGSDQMVWPQTIGVGIRAIDAAPFLTMQQKEDIFYNNAARFLRLTSGEIALHKGR